MTEADGCIISDDETLVWYAQEKTTLMLVEKETDWTAPTVSISSFLNDLNVSNISTENEPVKTMSLKENQQLQILTYAAPTESSSGLTLKCTEFDEVHETTTGLLPEMPPQNSVAFDSTYSQFGNEIHSTRSCDVTSISSLDTTLSISSTAASSCSDVVECTKIFRNFQIPWEKVSSDILESLARKEKIGTNLNRFANVIIDEMRKLSYFLPMNAIRTVCDKIAMKYPESFLECDLNGHILSATPFSLITTMKNRNNFMNRAPKKSKSEMETSIPIKQQRLVNTLKETCANWQPQNLPEGESINSMELKRNALIKLHANVSFSEEERKNVTEFMKECFPMQRKYFNNMERVPTIGEIKKNWPFIFDKENLYNHFQLLMNLDTNIFKTNFEKNKMKIHQIVKTTAEESPCGDEYTFHAIAHYFKEKTDMLYMKFTVNKYKKFLLTLSSDIHFITSKIKRTFCFFFFD